jgi:hypothetical protein
MGSERPSVALRRLVNGYQVSQAIHVAAKLGIADLLGDGPRGSDELAVATGTHAPTLYRLLRALASVGVFREEDGGRFALTPLGECLRSDAPEPVGGWAAFIGEPYHWQAWSALTHSVRTGENAFRHVHGMDPWTFREAHPELSVGFDRAMMARSRQVSQSVLAAYDFGRFASVVDVGGGNGAFLATILAKYPGMRGVLFDQPHVVAGAAPILEGAGVTDRCLVVGGSFFEEVPAGYDAYVFKAILHDWDDERCFQILRTCRRAMAESAALLVVEQELGPPNEGAAAKFSDLNMLVAPGGQERTPEEYAALFGATGFGFAGWVPTRIGVSVFQGVAA